MSMECNVSSSCAVRLLMRHPCLIFGILSIIIALTCSISMFSSPFPPKLSSPEMGFRTSGTDIANNWMKLQALRSMTSSFPHKGAMFLENPRLYRQELLNESYAMEVSPSAQKRESLHHLTSQKSIDANGTFVSRDDEPVNVNELGKSWADQNLYFCGHPDPQFGRIVFESADSDASLLEVEAIKAMCRTLQTNAVNHPDYKTVCEPLGRSYCCPVWTVGNYVALLNERASCELIQNSDVHKLKETIAKCRGFYLNNTLREDCWVLDQKTTSCYGVPYECYKYNAVYDVLHFLVDEQFATDISRDKPLRKSISFLPIRKGRDLLRIYDDRFSLFQCEPDSECSLSSPAANVIACDFGIEKLMFERHLESDFFCPLTAFVFTILAAYVYTRSLFLIFITLLLILASVFITISLFVYFVEEVLPFVAIMAIFILYCVSFDNLILIHNAWIRAMKSDSSSPSTVVSQSDNDPNSEKYLTDTTFRVYSNFLLATRAKKMLNHSIQPLLISNLTTIFSFFAFILSDIVVLKLFSLFAGILMVTNFILMLLFLPLSVVISQLYFSYCFENECNSFHFCRNPIMCFLVKKWSSLKLKVVQLLDDSLCSTLYMAILKLKYLSLLFSVINLSCIYFVLLNPSFSSPSHSETYPLFARSKLFEVYATNLKTSFRFEQKILMGTQKVPVIAVFGVRRLKQRENEVLPRLNDRFTGLSYQVIVDALFDLGSTETQQGLLDFCHALKNNRNLFASRSDVNRFCLMDYFVDHMFLPCKDFGFSVYPCCEKSYFPYTQDVFTLCMKRLAVYMNSYNFNPSNAFPRSGGLIFDSQTEEVVALIQGLETHLTYSANFQDNERLFEDVSEWFDETMAGKFSGVENSFVTSDQFMFLDLLKSLKREVKQLIIAGFLISFATYSFVSGNVVLATIASFTIVNLIVAVFLVLMFMGWTLNILEAIVLCMSIGLSVDHLSHFAMAYLQLTIREADLNIHVLSCVYQSCTQSILVCAFTSFAAGLALIPANLLIYTRIGVLLLVLQPLSCFYTLVIFPSLLPLFHSFVKNASCYSKKKRSYRDNTMYFNRASFNQESSNKFDGAELQCMMSEPQLNQLCSNEDLHGSLNQFSSRSVNGNATISGGAIRVIDEIKRSERCLSDADADVSDITRSKSAMSSLRSKQLYSGTHAQFQLNDFEFNSKVEQSRLSRFNQRRNKSERLSIDNGSVVTSSEMTEFSTDARKDEFTEEFAAGTSNDIWCQNLSLQTSL